MSAVPVSLLRHWITASPRAGFATSIWWN